ncbi:MAG: peptide ABC transporter substrate-binding protein [Bdellovibrionia bacterium]
MSHTVLFVSSIALLGALAGCSKGCSSDRSLLKQQTVLKVQLNAEPISLDPAEVEDGNGLKLIAELREGLVGYDSQGHLKNLLAQSYTVSPDGRRLEFTLKPDLKWSDGQTVMVEDFVFGIRRALEPSKGGKVSMELLPIRGAKDYRTGKIKPVRDPKDRTIGVYANEGKLIFELEQAAPYFIHALTLPAALPVRQDILMEANGKWTEDKAPGTGPYRFAAYQPGKRFLIEANPYYWGAQPEVRLIDFLFITDEAAALNLFETGQLDILTRLPPADIPRLRKLPTFKSDPFYATYFIAFNTRKAPFTDRDFRRAVSGAVQREEIVKTMDTGEKPALSWLPPGIEGFLEYQNPKSIFGNSIAKVKGELSHHPVAPVPAAFDTSARNSMIMEKIQHDLIETLGLKTSLSNMEWKAYVKSLQTDAPAIYRFGWLTPFADPINSLQAFTTGNPNNYAGWSNSEYDRLVQEIAGMVPGSARTEKIRKAQKILVEDDAAVVPIFHYVQNHLVSQRVNGFKVNPFGIVSFNEMSLNIK